MAKRVTIRDVATATGLHFTTVGLGLRDSPLLKPETRRKIQDAARALGYEPDPMLTALNAYRHANWLPSFQAVIGWINNWPDRGALLSNGTFHAYYQGARDRAQELGYLVEQFWLHEKEFTPARLRRLFKARSIKALLLPPQLQAHTYPPIDLTDCSVVCFGYSMQPALYHVITNHHAHSIKLVILKVMELGYRRIGMFVDSDWDQKVENVWLGGLMLARARYPDLAPVPPCTVDSTNRKELAAWMKRHRPDVVISWDGVAPEIEALGYRIPEDVGFVSLDLIRRDQRLSGINENNRYIGQKAVDLLVDMLHRGERGKPEIPIRTLVESTWVPGATLRPQGQ